MPCQQRVDSRHEVDVVPVALSRSFGPASALDHDDLGTGGASASRRSGAPTRRRAGRSSPRRRGSGRRSASVRSSRRRRRRGRVARAAVPEPFDASVLLVEREVRVVREDGSNPD